MITEKLITDAWAYLRTNNNSIPDDVLDFIKDSSLDALRQQNSRQTDCYTALELLGGELSKLDAVIKYGSVHAAIDIAANRRNTIVSAMELIKELQANAV